MSTHRQELTLLGVAMVAAVLIAATCAIETLKWVHRPKIVAQEALAAESRERARELARLTRAVEELESLEKQRETLLAIGPGRAGRGRLDLEAIENSWRSKLDSDGGRGNLDSFIFFTFLKEDFTRSLRDYALSRRPALVSDSSIAEIWGGKTAEVKSLWMKWVAEVESQAERDFWTSVQGDALWQRIAADFDRAQESLGLSVTIWSEKNDNALPVDGGAQLIGVSMDVDNKERHIPRIDNKEHHILRIDNKEHHILRIDGLSLEEALAFGRKSSLADSHRYFSIGIAEGRRCLPLKPDLEPFEAIRRCSSSLLRAELWARARVEGEENQVISRVSELEQVEQRELKAASDLLASPFSLKGDTEPWQAKTEIWSAWGAWKVEELEAQGLRWEITSLVARQILAGFAPTQNEQQPWEIALQSAAKRQESFNEATLLSQELGTHRRALERAEALRRALDSVTILGAVLAFAFLAAILISVTSSQLTRAPGFGLLSSSEFFFSKKTYTTVLEPVISDFQVEYIEALSQGRLLKARWVLVRGYSSFWTTALLQIPTALLGQLAKALGIWPVSR